MEKLNKPRFHFDNPILKKWEEFSFVLLTLSGMTPLERLFPLKPKAPI